MKLNKIFVAVALSAGLFALGAVGPEKAEALYVNVAVSTSIPTFTAQAFTDNGAPVISGGAVIRGVVCSNSASGSAAINISLYDTATASHTATLASVITIPTDDTKVVEFPRDAPLKLTNPGLLLTGTAGVGNCTLIYE